jgi:hypothetical protein
MKSQTFSGSIMEIDFRIRILTEIVEGFEKAMYELKERNRTVPWYDGLFLSEDAEHVYGLAFMGFQNYINGTIADLEFCLQMKFKRQERKNLLLQSHVVHSGIPIAHLMNTLANYYKHRDEWVDNQPPKNGKWTKIELDAYNLLEQDFPIIEGLRLMSYDLTLKTLLPRLINWRLQLGMLYKV